MDTYKHLNTGVVAELIEKKENTVRLKVAETGEVKEIGSNTFKRWWKTVEPEAAPEAPAEPQDSPDEPEAPKAEESTPKAEDPPEADRGGEDKPLALSEIVAKLEKLFDLLNGLHFDGKLPRPIMTVQSSPKEFGRCSVNKIWKNGAEGEDEGQYELNVGAEFLNRPSEHLAATVLHEMVHLYCRENGLDETCQNGRYHNKLFMQECESRGLEVEYNRAIGYAITLPGAGFVESLRSNGFALEVPFARHTIEKEKKKAERAKYHNYVCGTCAQTVRTTQDLNLICGVCEIPMERAE